ncbi:unnamed protein product [Fusarium graminearum]|nr:unnamed protein product [Fusarium graminearum]
MGSISWDEHHQYAGTHPWWKAASFYQVYPASFKDSNSDGWGDLPGLISKLDYLSDLGIDVVWVSPIFESPQKDMGYDVSDYQKIYEPYGSVEDVDTLIDQCHARGLKIILDLVVNHTSVEHEWFKESRSSKDNPKRDWYIWQPARYDTNGVRQPPTNWRGYFACSTWTWDEHTQEYYLHLYAPDQPDLNWDNEECREAIYDNTMRFWLDRGVDGFRIDTVNKYSKRKDFVDAAVTDPSSPHQPAPEMWCNGPRIHEFIHEMNEKVLRPYNAVSVGELSNTPHPSQVIPYVSAAAKELDMVFEFSMIRLGNGTLFLYQGQEIGMTNMPRSWGIEEYKDIESSNFFAEAVESGNEKRVKDTMHGLQIMARDHSRIPFQWDDSPNAGFTNAQAKPWMKVHDEYRDINVARQLKDPDSILSFYKEMLRLRKRYQDLFVFGSFKLVDPDDEFLFVYLKESVLPIKGSQGQKRKVLVVLNMSQEERPCPDVYTYLKCSANEAKVLLSTTDRFTDIQKTTLAGWEGRLYGSSVTFYDSSFFKRGSETITLPTPSEVLARPNFIQHPRAENMKLRIPAVFQELGLAVKHSDSTNTIISEGQCLWAVRRFLPKVPVPEVYGWTQENGIAFLYMEYIDGATLKDRWDSLTVTEKEGVCQELKTNITEISRLRQASDDEFIGNISRGPLSDMVFTGTNFPPVGPFSSATELHDCMSNMFKWPAKVRQPDIDLADVLDPYRDMLPDDCAIHFTHADLNPVNIMVSKDSPCRVMAIIDWEQSGWYPAYWDFFKVEMTTKPGSEWQTEYLPKLLKEPDPDCCEAFYSYVNSYAP